MTCVSISPLPSWCHVRGTLQEKGTSILILVWASAPSCVKVTSSAWEALVAPTVQQVLCVPQSNILKISSGLLKLQKTSPVISYTEIPAYQHLSAGLLATQQASPTKPTLAQPLLPSFGLQQPACFCGSQDLNQGHLHRHTTWVFALMPPSRNNWYFTTLA